MNKVNLIGRTANVEFKKFQDGTNYCKFSLATEKKWADRETGEMKKKTTWHNCQIIGDWSKIMERAKLGGKICAYGELTNFEIVIGEKKITATQIKVLELEIFEWNEKVK